MWRWWLVFDSNGSALGVTGWYMVIIGHYGAVMVGGIGSLLGGTFWKVAGGSGNSRSRLFPRMKASDSRSRIMGMDFFIPFLFPNFGNGIFHSLPVPKLSI